MRGGGMGRCQPQRREKREEEEVSSFPDSLTRPGDGKHIFSPTTTTTSLLEANNRKITICLVMSSPPVTPHSQRNSAIVSTAVLSKEGSRSKAQEGGPLRMGAK